MKNHTKLILELLLIASAFTITAKADTYNFIPDQSASTWLLSATAWEEGDVPFDTDDAVYKLELSSTEAHYPLVYVNKNWDTSGTFAINSFEITSSNTVEEGETAGTLQITFTNTGWGSNPDFTSVIDVANDIIINQSGPGSIAFRGIVGPSNTQYLHVKANNLIINIGNVQFGHWALDMGTTTSVEFGSIQVLGTSTLSFTHVTSFENGYSSNIGTIINNSSAWTAVQIKGCELNVAGFQGTGHFAFNSESSTITLTSSDTRSMTTGQVRREIDTIDLNIIASSGSKQAFAGIRNDFTNITVQSGGELHIASDAKNQWNNGGSAVVVIEGNGRFSPIAKGGESEIGSFNGLSMSLANAAILQFDVTSLACDKILLTGALSKSESWMEGNKVIFDFIGLDESMIGNKYDIMTFDSTDFLISDFATSNSCDGTFEFSEDGKTLSFIVTAVPESSTIAAIIGALALGFVCYRRRK